MGFCMEKIWKVEASVGVAGQFLSGTDHLNNPFFLN